MTKALALEAQLVERHIDVNVIEHKDTGLLVGLSDDMLGLYVAARSLRQIEAELPAAIAEMLEAEGAKVESVVVINEGAEHRFFNHLIKTNAKLTAPAAVDCQ